MTLRGVLARRRRLAGTAIGAARAATPALLAAAWLTLACSHPPRPAAPPTPAPPPVILGLDGQPDPRPDAAFVDTIRRECTVCHAAGRAADVPRALWRQRLQDMARFSLTRVGLPEGGASSLAQLELEPFVRYFEARAPEAFPAPEPWPAPATAGYERTTLSPKGAAPVPILADTRLFDLDGDGRLEIVACDMGHGLVLAGDPARRPGELRELAKVPNPVRASLADLDGDGRSDLLVADVGFFMPEDNTKGSVVWLRAKGDGTFEKRVLAEKLPRVMDVQAADFDGDGRLDLIVAAAGLYARGELRLLLNRTTDWKEPQFETHVLDTRSGALQASPADLDGDGHPDFVALFGQQHQKVVAFYSRADGRFEPRTLFSAPTPAWDASSMQLVDFDHDGDLDVLLANGETMDDAAVKPWHGVRWLENKGRVPFERHELAGLPGAHRAVAADLDGDGDTDVAVSVFLPDPERTRGDLASLGWLEQVRPGIFERRTLQAGQLSHFALDAGDLDGDGHADLVAGNLVGFTFARTDTGFRADGWVELWKATASRGPAAPPAPAAPAQAPAPGASRPPAASPAAAPARR